MGKILENPKQLILDNAKNILYNEGYSNLNIRSVAKACNLAVGTIYNYYPSKKELVIEMMVEYWKECFRVFESIIDSTDSLYEKLFKMFNELNTFISTFKEVWLKASTFETSDYSEGGMEKEHLYIEMLVRKIEALLIMESLKNDTDISIKADSYELAKFILMNFITMIQMPIFKYSSFEQILKQLLV